MFDGRHHWSDERLFERTKEYIQKFLNFKDPTDKEVWSIVLLMNPAKGIKVSKKKDLLNRPACLQLYRALGDKGIEVFRDIFSNNNKRLINEFFSQPIILKLWRQFV